jgi:hypothetical protein
VVWLSAIWLSVIRRFGVSVEIRDVRSVRWV